MSRVLSRVFKLLKAVLLFEREVLIIQCIDNYLKGGQTLVNFKGMPLRLYYYLSQFDSGIIRPFIISPWEKTSPDG